jgi:hypothetical protein
MNVIHMFNRFFMRVGNVTVQVFQKESTYVIAMVITYVGLTNNYKGQM